MVNFRTFKFVDVLNYLSYFQFGNDFRVRLVFFQDFDMLEIRQMSKC